MAPRTQTSPRTTPTQPSARTPKPKAGTKTGQARTRKPKADLTVDPELLNPEFNETRRPRLPYGIIVNDNPAGILIPVDQLESAGWLNPPDELDDIIIGENTVIGLFLDECRLVVLAKVPPYIRYKDADQLTERGGDETLAHTLVGPYDTHQIHLDKALMEVVSEHAVVFLDDADQPLHTTPIVIRFKNVALWSFISTCDDYYRKVEKAFAEMVNLPYSGKSDQWRSLVVVPVAFTPEKQGKGKNKSTCCKAMVEFVPTADTLFEVFLGTPQGKALIWGLHTEVAGFVESAPTAMALPPTPTGHTLPSGVASASPDDLELDGDDDEEFDPDDDEAIEVDAIVDEDSDEDDDDY
ncbi:hypothetical protein GFS31_40570 (plasmid) [Leptolyngbya sp. BL0902]|uniref:DUF5895 domain-containing protein n=1 Tax=Leptolyngbya sp. BL0902 TaxID=1115757 RepID=UPI0018E6E3EE|nr:DUF5895 domain-containing protein [Leptolyngbya sp. BL0902]QQE67344.1 hypothetical protein GFS31_40570 [Leptolyngbya sp. BL0902]